MVDNHCSVGYCCVLPQKPNVPDSQTLLHQVLRNMRSEDFKTFTIELSKDYPECLGSEPEELSVSDVAVNIVECFGGETALRITLHFQINNEHEVLRNELISQSRTTPESPLTCNDIFKTLPGQGKQIRTVLTMGIFGIGKHVSVQRFILDWADGKANQDINVIIYLKFRELNQKKGSCSLLQLIQHYAPELKEADLQEIKVLFILDGLEVCQYPLDFHNNDYCSDINENVPVDVLLTNLIKGNLLSSALLWITTRPSTASRIPPECVHRVTEIQGFNDHQKETYFRKKISDQKLANEIITHIKSCRSLYIMCHMPIFCWMSATVLENMMSNGNSDQIPRTLTEMFTHKLSEVDKTLILKLGELAFQQLEKGNLIFQEEDLIKSGLDVGKVTEYSVCTEMFREELGLYREKVYSFVHVSYQEYLAAIYAHFACVNDGKNVLDINGSTDLSDVHQSALNKALKSENGHLDLFLRFLFGLSVDPNRTLLQDLLTKDSSSKPCVDKNMTVHFIQEEIKQEQSSERIINLFQCLNELNDNTLVKEIQTAMKSGTLLGSELEPEQWSALAYVLLKSGEQLDEFDMKKFHTSTANQLRLLPVLRICKRARSVHSFNNKLDKSAVNVLLTVLLCRTTLIKMCKIMYYKVGVFPLSRQRRQWEYCKIAFCCICFLFLHLSLAGCNFPSAFCSNLVSAIQSVNSHLGRLDLSYNKISDTGMNKLCDGLISPYCRLQKLKLKRCGLTKTSCVYLVTVLKSNSHLRELELKSNDLQDSGVKQLSIGLQDPQCKLEILGLSGCMITEVGCRSLASALTSNTGHLRELDLSYNHPGDSGVKLLCAKKDDPSCKLETLQYVLILYVGILTS
uniref:Si:ch211-201o1.1 n=1 Tax=Sinocyclocheilus grahami TaxID=75366 RepID=A0A672LCD3_SINGR